jgi:ATP-dependent helicase/DNAse subunit B
MVQDKFSAVWISHSSLSDWLNCPRAYFLKNVYKDPVTGRKIALMSPPLSLGQAVHEVIESLSTVKVDRRFMVPLTEKFASAWKKVSGKRGGFISEKEEFKYKQRGLEMLARVTKNPGPLKRLAVKINMELPYYWLSEEDNIILCGKLDWLEYLPDENAVHIVDFKTGVGEEKEDSLQLPIYHLLASKTQDRPVVKVSYWYIDRDDAPVEKKLPDMKKAEAKILKLGKEIKLARSLKRFKCPHDGCAHCKPYEAIINGEAEKVGVDEIRKDVYILRKPEGEKRSEVL